MKKSDLGTLAAALFEHKAQCPNAIDLNKEAGQRFLLAALDLLYPQMVRSRYQGEAEVAHKITELMRELKGLCEGLKVSGEETQRLVAHFQAELLVLAKKIKADAMAILEGDPAANSLEEVILCYPGLFAIATYRLAHFFYHYEIPVLPRLLSELAHEKTGIDIHPGAQIGESFFIDHGTGVVIGETAVIGRNVKVYQGVTLGALSVEKSLARKKRHPTIEDDCVIYAHATILGGATVVGKASIIGGNVWMTKSVAPGSLVYHKSEVKLDSANAFNEAEGLIYEI